jgi:NAD(P)-dependent dehydrogenase (short-subunit alcohol dehydrogenase family)
MLRTYIAIIDHQDREPHDICVVLMAGTVDELDVATIANVTNINYMGIVNTVKAALPEMLQRGHGHILMISSILGAMGTKPEDFVLFFFLGREGFSPCTRP